MREVFDNRCEPDFTSRYDIHLIEKEKYSQICTVFSYLKQFSFVHTNTQNRNTKNKIL